MVKFKDPDIMSACAEKIIDRLYELALCDTRIMVCDWLAYATLATYRLVNELTGESDLPTMDECFDGTAVTPELSDNPKWGYSNTGTISIGRGQTLPPARVSMRVTSPSLHSSWAM